MIGDPSGRSTERTAMEVDVINHNLKSIEAQIQNIFDNHRDVLFSKDYRAQAVLKEPMKELT